MPIVEEFMDAGAWSVQLQEDTPRWVLDDIDVRDHLWASIVVCPHHFRVGDVSDANLLALARYAGVYLGMGEGRRSLYGKGLISLLGDEGDGGALHISYDLKFGPYKLEIALDELVFNAGNGLTVGTADGPLVEHTVDLEGGDTRREILDTLIQQSSAASVWKLSPAGVFNMNVNTTLFPTTTTPTAVFTTVGAREGNVDGIPAIIGVDELNGEEVRTVVEVDWDDGYNNGSAVLSAPAGWRSFAGAGMLHYTLLDWRPKRRKPPTERWRKLAAWQIQSETQANSMAARELNERSEVRNQLTVVIDEYDPWRFDITPGNYAYILEPDAKIQDLAVSVQYQGEVIHPKKALIQQWTTPIQEGYGVYLRYWTGAAMAFYDLTEWVDWEGNVSTLELGHRDRFAPETSPRRLSKQYKKALRRAARRTAFNARVAERRIAFNEWQSDPNRRPKDRPRPIRRPNQ